MNIKHRQVLITGGSKGLGLGIAEALIEKGADVTVVARDEEGLDRVAKLLGVATIRADITDQVQAREIVRAVRPDILILNAGTPPPMGPLDQISWTDFTLPWEQDVKGTLYWIQAALTLPLSPGARVLTTSSGAAVAGSPLSGGYAGAKRMVWFMAQYANRLSAQRHLGIQFQTIVPQQMVLGTGTGDRGAGAYAAALGTTPETFVGRFGSPMSPRMFGDHVLAVLEHAEHADGLAFGITADTGITRLEDIAA